MSKLTDWKQRALYELMSDISEECYCAGWMSGNEYSLWRIVSDPNASRRYGQGEVTEQQVTDMRTMADSCGGWIRWHDDEDEPNLDADEWGPRFELLADWQRRYERQMAVWDELLAKCADRAEGQP
jgi:hypothetical protein